MGEATYWKSRGNRSPLVKRLGRRSFIGGAAKGGVAVAALAVTGASIACGDDDGDQPDQGSPQGGTPNPSVASPTEQPKPGGTLVLGNFAETLKLDPISNPTTAMLIPAFQVY